MNRPLPCKVLEKKYIFDHNEKVKNKPEQLTPLFSAIWLRYKDVVEYLLTLGADITNTDANCVIEFAKRYSNDEIINTLKEWIKTQWVPFLYNVTLMPTPAYKMILEYVFDIQFFNEKSEKTMLFKLHLNLHLKKKFGIR